MKYLISIHRPNGFDHSKMLDETARQAIDAVNDEMVAAGVRLFVGGLLAPSSATSLVLQANGDVKTTEGPYLKAEDYVDGFWVLECSTLEDALKWGRKSALACRGSVEVREFGGAVVG